MIVKDKSLLKKRDPIQDGQRNRKKKKQDQNVSIVKNGNMNEDWKMRENEKWNQTFRHKSKDAPILNTNCRACLKFHVKGYCFENCKFKGLHIDLTGEDFEKTDEYIRSLHS